MMISDIIGQPTRMNRAAIVHRARTIGRMLMGVSDDDRKTIWAAARYAASLEEQIDERLNDFVAKRTTESNGYHEEANAESAQVSQKV